MTIPFWGHGHKNPFARIKNWINPSQRIKAFWRRRNKFENFCKVAMCNLEFKYTTAKYFYTKIYKLETKYYLVITITLK